MAYKPISSRQIDNAAALPNIGTPAFETLDIILADIDSALSGAGGGGTGYTAKQIPLTSGISSYSVSIPAQPDTSYTVFALMENLVDTFPIFQEPLITNKTTTGFTVEFNTPLPSSNYILSFIIPYKSSSQGETDLSLGANSVSTILPIVQPYSGYAVISAVENYGDANPQFQTAVVSSTSTTAFATSVNGPTQSANYVASYVLNIGAYANIGSGANSVTVNLPINYNTSSYGVITGMINTTDSNPQFQPLLITAKTDTSFTVSFNAGTLTSNYVLYYYAISLSS